MGCQETSPLPCHAPPSIVDCRGSEKTGRDSGHHGMWSAASSNVHMSDFEFKGRFIHDLTMDVFSEQCVSVWNEGPAASGRAVLTRPLPLYRLLLCSRPATQPPHKPHQQTLQRSSHLCRCTTTGRGTTSAWTCTDQVGLAGADWGWLQLLDPRAHYTCMWRAQCSISEPCTLNHPCLPLGGAGGCCRIAQQPVEQH